MSQAPTLQQIGSRIQQLLNAGKAADALALARDVARRAPAAPQVRQMLGALYLALGKCTSAVTELEQAVLLAPDNPRLLSELAKAYLADQQLEKAIETADQILKLQPNNAPIIAFKADVLFMQAEFDKARELLENAIAQPGSHPGLLLTLGKVLSALREWDKAVNTLEKFLAIPSAPVPMQADALFRLGRIYNSTGEYDKAFETINKANNLRKPAYNPELVSGAFREMKRLWTAEEIKELPTSLGSNSERPVFIVGMPRSGTSLVEQILASHKEIYGAGELGDVGAVAHRLQGAFRTDPVMLTSMEAISGPALTEAASSYLDHLKSISSETKFVTDKMPLNFLHLGLISKMLPGAKIIHCRRDPVDTCISCYFQNFAGNNPYAYDLSHLGTFYRQYEGLMEHWKQVLDIPVLDVTYEDVVEDLEGQAKRMLDFLNLDWDENCLHFHESGRATMTASAEQVRRPLYKTSVNRREHYRKYLKPLIDSLNGTASAE